MELVDEAHLHAPHAGLLVVGLALGGPLLHDEFEPRLWNGLAVDRYPDWHRFSAQAFRASPAARASARSTSVPTSERR